MKATIPKGLPSTGWWLDNEIIPCYHGTFSPKLFSIQEHGLLPGSSGLCYVSPGYSTAATFALWGLEGIDASIARGFTGGFQVYPPNRYAVIHFGIPRDFIQENGLYRRGDEVQFFRRHSRPKLADRSFYDAFDGHDEEYYYMEEIKFTCPLPPEMITGISMPYL